MRIILVFILLAFGFWPSAVNGQHISCAVPELVEGTASGASTSSATAYLTTVDCCPLSVDYYESQISKADSLYKNYLPQYNFDEVKAAMEFFDSLQLSKTTDNGQQTLCTGGQRTTVNRQQTLSTEVKQSRPLVMHAHGLLTVVRCPLTSNALKRIITTPLVSQKKTTL